MGNAQWAALAGLGGFFAPYLFKYLKEYFDNKNNQIKEQINEKNERIKKIEQELRETQSSVDRRVDEVESLAHTLQGIVQDNKEAITTATAALEQLRGEAYSALGSAQNAIKISEVSLGIGRDAQDSINHVLRSGSLIQMAQQITEHDLEITILKRKLNSEVPREEKTADYGENSPHRG